MNSKSTPRKPHGKNEHGYEPFAGYEWIGSNPGIFGGKPIIDGKRFSVEQLAELIASGQTEAEIRENFPSLPIPECVAEVLHYWQLRIDTSRNRS